MAKATQWSRSRSAVLPPPSLCTYTQAHIKNPLRHPPPLSPALPINDLSTGENILYGTSLWFPFLLLSHSLYSLPSLSVFCNQVGGGWWTATSCNRPQRVQVMTRLLTLGTVVSAWNLRGFVFFIFKNMFLSVFDTRMTRISFTYNHELWRQTSVDFRVVRQHLFSRMKHRTWGCAERGMALRCDGRAVACSPSGNNQADREYLALSHPNGTLFLCFTVACILSASMGQTPPETK